MSENITKTAAAYDTIVICVSNARSADIANALKGSGKRVAVLSIMSPVNAESLEWADEIIFGYSYSPYTFAAMFGALCGEYKASGTKPFSISE